MIYGIVTADNSHIKIGTTASPTQRLKELQTGSHAKLKLIAVLQGDYTEERKLHQEFEKYKVAREWFVNNTLISQYMVANSEIDFWGERLSRLFELQMALRSLWFDALTVKIRDISYNQISCYSNHFKPRIKRLVGYNAGLEIASERDDKHGSQVYWGEEINSIRIEAKRRFAVYEELTTSIAYETVSNWIMTLLPEVR